MVKWLHVPEIQEILLGGADFDYKKYININRLLWSDKNHRNGNFKNFLHIRDKNHKYLWQERHSSNIKLGNLNEEYKTNAELESSAISYVSSVAV